MLPELAGEGAKGFAAETPGVYRRAWSVEEVAAAMETIEDISQPVVFPSLPSGFHDHLKYRFHMSANADE